MYINDQRSNSSGVEVGLLKSRLIVRVAHVFNPLLSSISSAANALQQDYTLDEHEQNKLERVAEIQVAVEQLLQVLENMQTINRIYANDRSSEFLIANTLRRAEGRLCCQIPQNVDG
jgi:signal transduction histidine kinase